MRIQYTSQCLHCGRSFDDGAMTGLTAERDSTKEHVHFIVSYARCCRPQAIQDAGVRFNANGVDQEPGNYARWMAFLDSETIETIRTVEA